MPHEGITMLKFKIFIPLLLIAVFMVSTYSVIADSGSTTSTNDGGVSSQQEKADQRSVTLDYSPSEKDVELNSYNTYNGALTEISSELNALNGLQIQFSYSGNINQIESELQMNLEARKVVEFINNNTAIPGYDAHDTLLHTYDLRSVDWTISVSNNTVNGITVYIVKATGALTSSATISFTFDLSNGYAQLAAGNVIGPNVLKWSMQISNYQYSSPNSQLALQMTMSSGYQSSDKISSQTEDHTDGLTLSNESAVNFDNGTTHGFFSWADQYSVDGHNQTVVTSPDVSVDKQDPTQNQMYFSFLQGKIINWDPKVGVTRSSTSLYDIQHPYVPVTSSSNSGSSSSSGSNSNSVATNSPSVSSSSAFNKNKTSPGFEIIAVMLSLGVIGLVSKRKFKN